MPLACHTSLLARRFTKRSFVRDPREFATQTMSCVARQANAIRFGSLALREFAAQTSTYGDAPLANRIRDERGKACLANRIRLPC